MHNAENPPVEGDTYQPVPDLSGLPLDAILNGANSVLDNALRRQLDELNAPETYAAHGTTPI